MSYNKKIVRSTIFHVFAASEYGTQYPGHISNDE